MPDVRRDFHALNMLQVDMQAMARVHRIGQSRQTHVHRFVIKGTFEPSLAAERLQPAIMPAADVAVTMAAKLSPAQTEYGAVDMEMERCLCVTVADDH